jgi:N-acyl-D-aspartate/D-glutamate deacylase
MAEGSAATFDLVLAGGTVHDGTGAPARVVDVGIVGDTITAIGPGLAARARRVIDCAGRWVTPGFIDLHTHYDAEIEVSAGLPESVRHGVTTVVLGSCSLSLAVGRPDDLADMFCRVEGLPDAIVRPMIHAKKSWDSHRDYLDHLEALPLGPNVASFVGHSAVRARVMGLECSATKGARPTPAELDAERAIVEDALDAGYLGLSVQTLPWDKLGGTRDWRSRPLPSTFARWSEVRLLADLLRRRGAILQGVPNISTKWNVILFLLESMGLWRRPLKTTVVSMMDIVASPGIHRVIGIISRVFNRVLGADFRWQALPEVFDLWSDGLDVVVFEEFGAGAAALHIDDPVERTRLLQDPAWRARFKKEWRSVFSPRAFHRDLGLARIESCPDASKNGRKFRDLARERGVDEVDAFLDLVVEHGAALRWYTVMGNGREESIAEITRHPDVLMGFSDAGAHLRSMAHYNFPLRLLRHARRMQHLTIEQAVWRCTGEIADWLGLDAGRLREGARADVVVVDPAGLDDRLEEAVLAPMPELGGFERLVRRNDAAVPLVLIGGAVAVESGRPTAALGTTRLGRVLRRREPTTAAPGSMREAAAL